MTHFSKVIFTILLLFASVSLGDFYHEATKYIFNSSETNLWGARCLDGSSSGFFYVTASTPASRDKWVIYLEGGGYCIPNATLYSANITGGDIDDCYVRMYNYTGTSTKWKHPGNYTPPSFASTWNNVWVPYCGGDYHSGQMNKSQGGLYYAGHLTVNAVIQKLKESFGLGSASAVLLAGDSAGGVGVIVNVDFVKTQLPSTVNLMAFPNAGWGADFLPYFGPYQDPSQVQIPQNFTAVAVMYSFAHSYLNVKCRQNNAALPFMCFAAAVAWPYINETKIPFFVAQSMFDKIQLGEHIANFSTYKFNYPPENDYIMSFGKYMRNSTLTAALPANGLFVTSTLEHVIGPNDSITIGQQTITLDTAMTNWYNMNGHYQIIDPCITPNCASTFPH